MSSFFHRRARSASAQRPQTPTSSSSSAHKAAAQAFLSSQTSQGNLSASAAAAALRAMSPPPTQVADVQTKRTQRRASSRSQSPRGRSTGGLDRQSSNGSMTERTFRTPSPGRPPTQGGQEAVPPVPSLPQNIPQPPPFSTKAQRRTVSLEAPTDRTTRIYSPASRTFIAASVPQSPATPPQPQSPQSPVAASSYSPHELQRTDSRNSINFSYPRPTSPPIRSPASPVSALRDSQSSQNHPLRNGITPAQAEAVKYDVAHAAQAPVKKKKKKLAPQSSEGSHLSSGTMASKPVTTPLEPGHELPSQPPPQPSKKKKKEKVILTGENTHFPSDSGQSASDSAAEQTKRTQRASGVLMKQPSVVREDWEGEQAQQQSEVQEVAEQSLSPTSSPPSVPSKKTTAANMSRKIEEPQVQTKPPAAPVYQPVAVDKSPSPSVPPPNEQLLQPEPTHRTASLSPSRSTRFSDRLSSDLGAGRKHEPLPRSYSPGKSALKHHTHDGMPTDPAQQAREASATPSDASDLSIDGTMRRRKSARVSFEPEPQIVGISADIDESEEPAPAGPESKDSGKRSFFGFGRAKPTLTTIPSEEDIDEYMKPRPQLPSFGSIRLQNRRNDSSDSVGATPSSTAPRSATSTAQSSSETSESSSNANAQSRDEGVSSDHQIGGVLAQQVAKQAASFSTYAPAIGPPPRDPNLPLPPEVTSVEGSGYASDSESESSDEDATEDSARRSDVPTNDVRQSEGALNEGPVKSIPQSESSSTIPAVAVQPPTPKLEQTNPADQWVVDVPGGFPEAVEQLDDGDSQGIRPASNKQVDVTPSVPPTVQAPSTAIAEPAPSVPSPEELEEEVSDNASIYSDAAEDIDDLEGDGFGSINAIVESPVVTATHKIDLSTPPQSPLAQVTNSPDDSNRPSSWDETQQKWSGIAKQTRAAGTQAQPAGKSLGVGLEDSKWASAPAQPATVPISQPKPKKKKKQSPAAVAAALAPTASSRQVLPDSPPRKAKNQGSAYPPIDNSGSFRQSMRTQPSSQAPAAAGGFRGSMRAQPSQPESAFRSSMRGPPPPARAKPTPQPAPTYNTPPRAALQKKNIPQATTTQAAAVAPSSNALRRTLSNDSDSDSSFQRARRSKRDTGGSYSMKRSMRADPSPSVQPAGRGAVRSLSPPQRRPFSPVGQSNPLRTSMRGSLDNATPTLRGQPEQKRSSSLFGRRKAKSPSPTPVPAFRPMSSRIKDSDDEDEPRQSTFRSRFEDSSDDEDEPYNRRPVSGRPRKVDDGDSTDLEDSSDEERKTTKPKPQALKTDTKNPPATTQTGASLSPTSPTKKKGLFSRLRSKKDKDIPVASPVATRNALDEQEAPKSESLKDDGADSMGKMGFASTTERDEMIRQTMAKLEAARPSVEAKASIEAPKTKERISAKSPTRGGKLQRRAMGSRVMSDSWPLPDKPMTEAASDTRPSTSSGVPGQTNGNAIRPVLGQRIPTSETMGSIGGVPGRSEKKKRFPMLRRALGIRD